MTDIGGVTERVVAPVPVLDDVRLDVVIGSEAASLPGLHKLAAGDRRIRLWVDNAEMATLTADADIAIGRRLQRLGAGDGRPALGHPDPGRQPARDDRAWPTPASPAASTPTPPTSRPASSTPGFLAEPALLPEP